MGEAVALAPLPTWHVFRIPERSRHSPRLAAPVTRARYSWARHDTTFSAPRCATEAHQKKTHTKAHQKNAHQGAPGHPRVFTAPLPPMFVHQVAYTTSPCGRQLRFSNRRHHHLQSVPLYFSLCSRCWRIEDVHGKVLDRLLEHQIARIIISELCSRVTEYCRVGS